MRADVWLSARHQGGITLDGSRALSDTSPSCSALTLWQRLEQIPDRRSRKGRQYALPAVLTLALAAMLAGANDLQAIFRWGRRLPPEALFLLGLKRAPCHAMDHYFFKALDVTATEAALGAWVRAAGPVGHVALDGKRLRGSASAANVSPISLGPVAWPGAAQICRIERTRERAGTRSREIAYAVTSLTPEQAGPDAVLALWRDHWQIENRLHWRRDVLLGEDRSRIRCKTAPQAMAALRNAILHLTRNRAGPLAATREAMAENRQLAISAAKRGFL